MCFNRKTKGLWQERGEYGFRVQLSSDAPWSEENCNMLSLIHILEIENQLLGRIIKKK